LFFILHLKTNLNKLNIMARKKKIEENGSEELLEAVTPEVESTETTDSTEVAEVEEPTLSVPSVQVEYVKGVAPVVPEAAVEEAKKSEANKEKVANTENATFEGLIADLNETLSKENVLKALPAVVGTLKYILFKSTTNTYCFGRILWSDDTDRAMKVELLVNLPVKSHEEILNSIKGTKVVMSARKFMNPSGML